MFSGPAEMCDLSIIRYCWRQRRLRRRRNSCGPQPVSSEDRHGIHTTSRVRSIPCGTWRSRSRTGLLSVALAVLLVGCTSSSASKPTEGFTIAPQPHSSGGASCDALASERALRQLPSVLQNLYSKSKATEVHEAIANVIEELGSSGTGAPQALSASMGATAVALRPLLSVDPSAASVRSASRHLQDLADQVQRTCHFSKP